MANTNIELFDDMCGKILSYLKLSFPKPVRLGPESLGLEVSKKGTYEAGRLVGQEEETEQEVYFRDTLFWLHAEEIIYARESHGRLLDVVLTSKGLSAAGVAPKSLESLAQ